MSSKWWRTNHRAAQYTMMGGTPMLTGFPDVAYQNDSDGSPQHGQCVFLCQPKNKDWNTRGHKSTKRSSDEQVVLSTTAAELHAFMTCYGAAQFYRGCWMDTTTFPVELNMCTKANNLVTILCPTVFLSAKKWFTQDCLNCQMHDLAHILTQCCFADKKRFHRLDRFHDSDMNIASGPHPYTIFEVNFGKLNNQFLVHKGDQIYWMVVV